MTEIFEGQVECHICHQLIDVDPQEPEGVVVEALTVLRQWVIESPASDDALEQDRLNAVMAMTRAAITRIEEDK